MVGCRTAGIGGMVASVRVGVELETGGAGLADGLAVAALPEMGTVVSFGVQTVAVPSFVFRGALKRS